MNTIIHRKGIHVQGRMPSQHTLMSRFLSLLVLGLFACHAFASLTHSGRKGILKKPGVSSTGSKNVLFNIPEVGAASVVSQNPELEVIEDIDEDFKRLYIGVAEMRAGDAKIRARPETEEAGISQVENLDLEEGLYTGDVKEKEGMFIPHGKGKMEYKTGHVYDGDWSNGKTFGYGTMTYAYDDLYSHYSGTWRFGMRSGNGELKYRNGDVYIGSFFGNLPHRKGRMIYADTSVYIGDWEEGKRNGKGKLGYPKRSYPKFDSKISYDGFFSNDFIHGIGTMKYADGSVYIGEWKYGERSSNFINNKLIFPNGDVYTGAFEKGGYGTMKYADGRQYYGEWIDLDGHEKWRRA